MLQNPSLLRGERKLFSLEKLTISRYSNPPLVLAYWFSFESGSAWGRIFGLEFRTTVHKIKARKPAVERIEAIWGLVISELDF